MFEVIVSDTGVLRLLGLEGNRITPASNESAKEPFFALSGVFRYSDDDVGADNAKSGSSCSVASPNTNILRSETYE